MGHRFIVLVLGIVVLGCETNKRSNMAEQGMIEYEIDYPSEIASRPVSHLLPEKLQVYFAGDRLKLQIKGDLNLFSLDFFALAGGDSCYTVFKMLNRRMLVPMTDNERWFLFSDDQPFRYRVEKDSLRTIAGFNCHKVTISRNDAPDESYDAWFTEELPLTARMMRTPFEKIPGVPMAFEITFKQMTFRFKASAFSCNAGNEPIAIPKGCELATRQEMKEMINMFLN